MQENAKHETLRFAALKPAEEKNVAKNFGERGWSIPSLDGEGAGAGT